MNASLHKIKTLTGFKNLVKLLLGKTICLLGPHRWPRVQLVKVIVGFLGIMYQYLNNKTHHALDSIV